MHFSHAHRCVIKAMRYHGPNTHSGLIARTSGYSLRTTYGCLRDLKQAGMACDKKHWTLKEHLDAR